MRTISTGGTRYTAAGFGVIRREIARAISYDPTQMSSDPPVHHEGPPRPIPHSYWVEPGRLLAGEYPSSVSRGEARDRLERLLSAGITSFIDLTERGELEAYESLLPQRPGVEYRRFPVRDHGVPATPAVVIEALDAIEAALAAGRSVYVHCHAGIGRTGTIIGCYLIRRRGYRGSEALEELQLLWQQCLRSQSWPDIPETSEQVEFVRQWREPRRAGAALFERAAGALLGLGTGEALGRLAREIGQDAQALRSAADAPGMVLRTGVETATTRCLAESLLVCGGHDPQDQMERYVHWTRSVAPDEPVPQELKRALASWQWSRKPLAGSHDPNNRDPHSLARTLAVALHWRTDPAQAVEIAAEISRTTQQSPVTLEACRVWAAVLIDALAGTGRPALLTLQSGAAAQLVRQRKLRRDVMALLDGRWRTATSHGAGVLSVMGTALWAFERAASFDEGLLLAVSHSRAPQTAGALYGSLAGACGAIAAIPSEWRDALAEERGLRELAGQVMNEGSR